MADVEETTQEKDLPQSNIDFEWWWTHVITPIFSWLGDVISSLFPWVLFLLFFLSKDVRISLKALFKRIGDANEFQIGGMRFNLTNQEFDHYYDAYSKRRRKKLMQIYDILVEELDLIHCFTFFINTHLLKSLSERGIFDFRCTIHLLSPHDKEYLYQAIEYYPKSDQRLGITSRGRMTSIRFGITGRAVRDGKPHYDGFIRTAQLISLWGMTKGEAENAGKGELSMLSMPIINIHQEPIGCVFVGIKEKHAFGVDDTPAWRDEILTVQNSTEWKKLVEISVKIQKEGAKRWDEVY